MTIVVTGGNGLVGSTLKKFLSNAIYLSRKDYDLENEQQVIALYKDLQPSRVIHLAATVGGITDNIARPADYFYNNVLMNTFLIKHAYENGVDRFTGILSTCIYPDEVESYPLKEEQLHIGPPAATNFSYGYAKRCMAVHIDAVNRQHNVQYNYLIPCNLYGEHDKAGASSHFVTALVHKIYNAKQNNLDSIDLMGDGTPLRQFMLADDFAKTIAWMVEQDITQSFNVATTQNLSIKQIAETALVACNADHLTINWDTGKPNGQHRKDVSIDRLLQFMPEFTATDLQQGIQKVYDQLGQ